MAGRALLKKPEHVFLLLVIVFGPLFVVLSPPMKVNDEFNHFGRVYALSKGEIIPEAYQGIPGTRVPMDVAVTWDSLLLDKPYNRMSPLDMMYNRSTGVPGNPVEQGKALRKESIIKSFSITNKEIREDHPYLPQTMVMVFPNTAIYSPVPYVPQLIGFGIGRATGLPPVMFLYLGRLCNLLAWTTLIFLAIRATPVLKWGFLLLALTPMSLFLAASLSADAMTNGLSFLFIAYVLHYAVDTGDARRTPGRIFIPAFAVLLPLCKYYFFLPLLFLLIGPGKYPSKKAYYGTGALVAGVSLVTVLVWSSFESDIVVPIFAGVNPGEQLSQLLKNPWKPVILIINTFERHSEALVREFFGNLGHFGQAEVPWPTILFYVTGLGYYLSIGGLNFGLKQRAATFCVLFLSVIFIVSASYVYNTAVGADVVNGLQGRYFAPVAPLLLLLLTRNNTSFRLRRKAGSASLVIGFGIALSLTQALYLISTVYYG